MHPLYRTDVPQLPRVLFLYIQSINIFNYFFLDFLSPSSFIPPQNVVYFLMLLFLVHKMFTFYINGLLNCKCPAPEPKGLTMRYAFLPVLCLAPSDRCMCTDTHFLYVGGGGDSCNNFTDSIRLHHIKYSPGDQAFTICPPLSCTIPKTQRKTPPLCRAVFIWSVSRVLCS